MPSQLRQQLGPLVLDRAVVALGDRDQQAVAPAEVVVEGRRVALPRGLDDALQRDLMDPVAGEHLLRGAQQRLPRVGRVTSHGARERNLDARRIHCSTGSRSGATHGTMNQEVG